MNFIRYLIRKWSRPNRNKRMHSITMSKRVFELILLMKNSLLPLFMQHFFKVFFLDNFFGIKKQFFYFFILKKTYKKTVKQECGRK